MTGETLQLHQLADTVESEESAYPCESGVPYWGECFRAIRHSR